MRNSSPGLAFRNKISFLSLHLPRIILSLLSVTLQGWGWGARGVIWPCYGLTEVCGDCARRQSHCSIQTTILKAGGTRSHPCNDLAPVALRCCWKTQMAAAPTWEGRAWDLGPSLLQPLAAVGEGLLVGHVIDETQDVGTLPLCGTGRMSARQ